MGQSSRSADYMPLSQQAPQTGINPNPPAVTTSSQPAGKGGASVTYSSQSGQPQMGVPNQYTNTMQPGNNTSMQSVSQPFQGKGGSGISASPARGKGM